jgi:hypothetical protein
MAVTGFTYSSKNPSEVVTFKKNNASQNKKKVLQKLKRREGGKHLYRMSVTRKQKQKSAHEAIKRHQKNGAGTCRGV